MANIRDDIEAASAELNSTPETEPAEVVAAPVDSTPAPETEEVDATETPKGAVRDSTGKFAKAAKPEVDATEEPKAVEPTKTEPPKPGESDATRAPSSWRSAAREKWAALPVEVRKEVDRVNAEVQRVMQGAAEHKRMASEYGRVLEPMAEHIRARGISPPALVASYVEADRALSSNDQGAKAGAIARLIQAYGVDIEALAGALDGSGRQQAQPRFDPEAMRQQLKSELAAEMRQERERHELSQHVRQVEEFARSKDADLMNDEVRHDMAALIDSAAARGVALSLQEAYSRAVLANPETRAIVEQRQAAQKAATAQAATQRAHSAGSSVKSRPSSPNGGSSGSQSLRADMEAVAAQLSGR